jgi:hypothetical protein
MKTYKEQKQALADWIKGLPGALPFTLYSSAELLKVFDPEGSTRLSAYNVGQELKRQGFKLAADSLPCQIGKKQMRLWILRELSEDKYGRQSEAVQTYNEERMK